MALLRTLCTFVAGLGLLQGVHAGLDLSSNSTVVVYWGQNSFRGTGNLAQQRLGYYCDGEYSYKFWPLDEYSMRWDGVIILAFLMTINGPGGAPEIDFASATEKCEVFPGTNLKNCPDLATDIPKCQSSQKTILLSIGGATYSEGGFPSKPAAEASADLLWATFGPEQAGNNAHRPFGKAVIDGFDFDFEAAVSNTGAFATRMRALMDADTSKRFYLTAAPQCPFPDAADKDILNTDASAAIDAVFVQFYNNYCGVNAFVPERVARKRILAKKAQTNFNFQTWDNWALTSSKNSDVRVFLGVPANTGAASTGYLPVSQLQPIISYVKKFESFGGVMMWDVTQAYGNQGFLGGVRAALGKGGVTQQPQQPLQGQQGQGQGQPTAITMSTMSVAMAMASVTAMYTPAPAPGAQEEDGTEAGEQQANQQGEDSDSDSDQPSLLDLIPSILDPAGDLPLGDLPFGL
ncbi:glycoside hydrolase superfamily [Aspergillus californicus]